MKLSFLSRLTRLPAARLRLFAEETRGSVTVEAAIMLPLLVWAYCALYTFFDAYRQTSLNQKAAYTISDMISRETDPIDDDFLDGAYDMLSFLARRTTDRQLRVSIVAYDGDEEEHHVEWSHARGGVAPLDDSSPIDWDEKLPGMVEEERLIVVETWSTYNGPFSIIALNGQSIRTFVFTRPRFVVGQVCWESCVGT